MATSFYDDKNIIPNVENVPVILKDCFSVWQELIKYLEDSYGELTFEWKFYGKSSGWSYRISSKKRNLVFLLPNEDYFLVNINMGVKVATKVLEANIDEEIKTMLANAKVYQEGTGVLLKITKVEDLNNIKTILQIRDTS